MATYSLTVTAADVAATLSDFPAYIDLSQMPASFWSTVTTNAQTHSVDFESSSSQYASRADASKVGLEIIGDLTLEAWVRLESLTGAQVVIDEGRSVSGTVARAYALVILSDGSLQLSMGDGSGANSANTVSSYITTGSWMHIAMVRDATANDVEFYVNGSLKETISYSGTPVKADQAFTIGAQNIDGSRSAFVDGLVKDARVFDDARTADEIRADMQVQTVTDANLQGEWNFNNNYTDTSGNGNTLTPSGSPVFSTDVPFTNAGRDIRAYSDSGLTTELPVEVVSCDTTGETGEAHVKTAMNTSTVVYLTVDGTSDAVRSTDTYGSEAVWSDYAGVYHMDDTSGTLFDSTANANHGTFNGDLPTTATGQLGNGQSADGTGDFINFGTAYDFHNQDYSFSIWAKKDNTNSTQQVMGFQNGRSYIGYEDQGANGFEGDIFDGSSHHVITSGNTTTGVYHYMVLTQDVSAPEVVFYFNGVSQGSTANSTNRSATAESGLFNRTDGNDRFWAGDADEARILAGVTLSADWITTEYNNQSDVAGFWTIAEVQQRRIFNIS